MKRPKWEIGSQVTVTFRRKPIDGANLDKYPAIQYLGTITSYNKSKYTVVLEGSKFPFAVSEDQVDSILGIFAGIK